MKSYQIDITLLEDVIMTKDSTTLGAPESLDYIPGAALLGACAARLYNKLDREVAWALFHSGRCRFGNALLVSDSGEVGKPMPLAWHYEKGQTIYGPASGQSGQQLSSELIHNQVYSQALADSGRQPKQMRSGYVTSGLEWLRANKTLRMKTAIDPDTARASKGQLFGYQALQAGQHFRARLDIDNDLVAGMPEAIESVLECLQGSVLLGRSRSAQYGKVSLNISPAEPVEIVPDASLPASKKGLLVWLLSDMALADAQGNPADYASLTLPGLGEGVKPAYPYSFLRFRRYNVYNAKRRSYDLERQVLAQGSVLFFDIDPADIGADVWLSWQRGIGQYRESGLGQVSVNHPLLLDEHPVAISEGARSEHAVDSVSARHEISKPDHPLLRWVSQRSKSEESHQIDAQQAKKLAKELASLYGKTRSYRGLSEGQPIGPGASQWSRVMEAGRQYAGSGQATRENLFRALFGELIDGRRKRLNQCICKAGDVAWDEVTFDRQNREVLYAVWLEKSLQHEKVKHPGRVVTLLAKQAIQLNQGLTQGGLS